MNLLQVQAGYSETDITPDRPTDTELIGFNRPENHAKSILHPLKAQALVFRSGKLTCCILTVDSIGITTALTDQLREKIANKLHCLRENVMVCYSHTHSAPDAAANHGNYFQSILPKIIAAVETAYETTFPIKAAWGIAKNTIGINRRKGSSVVEHRLGVLKISNALTNKTELLLLRVTAHPNVLTADNYLISSDYFGVTRNLLEKEYSCKVLMTQGAAGNIRSKFRQRNADALEEDPFEFEKKLSKKVKQTLFEESLAALRKNAEEIARSVNVIWDKLQTEEVYRLRMFSHTQTFYTDVPTLEKAQLIVTEAEKEAGIAGGDWFNEVKRLRAAGIIRQSTTREIQFFALNDGCLCGVPDEPMCEIAIAVRQKAKDNLLFFGGYTNGYEGYLANDLEYDRGGYEVLWSNLVYYKFYDRLMPFNRDTADELSSFVADIWQKEKASQ
ncbi:hypothetical protein [Enterococcus sp. AZ109]|uniref:hypothetical protein n=1 Tax=Enterococcus sp. AZ109 TaxID=2774634 RepID=UPI003F240E36